MQNIFSNERQGMIIDILCPTRGRPLLAKQMYNSVCATVTKADQVRVWLYLSDNDSEIDNYGVFDFAEGDVYWEKNVEVNVISGCDAPTTWLWNKLSSHAYSTSGDLFFLIGDDVIFETEGWDEIYRQAASNYPDGIFVLAPNDGRGDGVPHPCMGREWIDTLGYFVNPAFLHWGVDSYSEFLASSVDRLIKIPNVTIRHNKVGEAHIADETYKRLREGVWNQRDLQVLELMKSRYADKDIGLLKQCIDLKKIYKDIIA